MPAPVTTTVDWGLPYSRPWSEGDGGAVKKDDRAAIAPVMVFANRGRMVGAGKGPV